MLNPFRVRVLIGVALILAGLFALIDVFGVVDVGFLGIALIFLVGGVVFLYFLATNPRTNWWAAIPGMTLTGIGFLIAVNEFLPRRWESLSGAIVPAFIGLAFLVIYLMNREFWWALIPCGVMFSSALSGVAGTLGSDGSAGWVFILGLSATFALVALFPVFEGRRQTWAFYPAGILLVISLFWMIFETDIADVFLPVAMILGGGYLTWRAVNNRARVL